MFLWINKKSTSTFWLKNGPYLELCITTSTGDNLHEMTNEQETNRTYNKTCVTSKDSDQSVHPPSTTRVLVYVCLCCGFTAKSTQRGDA